MAKTTIICFEKRTTTLRYGLIKLFKHGITLGILPTYRCNLDCIYCANKYGRKGNKFLSKEITTDDWFRIISNFPVKIRELHITGGEPTLYKDIQELILKLLPLNFNISMYSNLLKLVDLSKIKSDRFRIEATCHKSKNLFNKNLIEYRKYVRVDVDYFGDEEIKRNSSTLVKIKKKMNPGSPVCLDMKRFKITPDGRIWHCDREIGDTYSIEGGIPSDEIL